MLAPLIDDKQKISLIENSGVQFPDFGLQLFATQARRQFVRQTANGPLLRLNMDGNSGKFLLYPQDGGAPEVVRPENRYRAVRLPELTGSLLAAAANAALRLRSSLYRRPGKLGAHAVSGAEEA